MLSVTTFRGLVIDGSQFPLYDTGLLKFIVSSISTTPLLYVMYIMSYSLILVLISEFRNVHLLMTIIFYVLFDLILQHTFFVWILFYWVLPIYIVILSPIQYLTFL